MKFRLPTEEELKRARSQGWDGITEVGEWSRLERRFFWLRFWKVWRNLRAIGQGE